MKELTHDLRIYLRSRPRPWRLGTAGDCIMDADGFTIIACGVNEGKFLWALLPEVVKGPTSLEEYLGATFTTPAGFGIVTSVTPDSKLSTRFHFTFTGTARLIGCGISLLTPANITLVPQPTYDALVEAHEASSSCNAGRIANAVVEAHAGNCSLDADRQALAVAASVPSQRIDWEAPDRVGVVRGHTYFGPFSYLICRYEIHPSLATSYLLVTPTTVVPVASVESGMAVALRDFETTGGRHRNVLSPEKLEYFKKTAASYGVHHNI